MHQKKRGKLKLKAGSLLFVFAPDHVQPVQNQIFAVSNAAGAGIQNAFGELAGGNGGSVLPKLGTKTRHQPVDHHGGAQHSTGVQAGSRCGGQHAAHGGIHIYMGKLARVAHQRVQRKVRPGADHTAHQLPGGVYGHHAAGGVHVDQNQRRFMDLQRGHGPAQKLGTQLRGIVDAQGQPAAHSGAHNAHTHRIKHFKGGLYRAGQAGHNAAQNGALYLLGGNVVQRKHAADAHGVFICRGGLYAGQACGKQDRIVFKGTQRNVGVADVYGKDHGKGSFIS